MAKKAQKTEKTVDEMRQEFFEREARAYAARVQPVEETTEHFTGEAAEAVRPETTEETGETTDNEETAETKGE